MVVCWEFVVSVGGGFVFKGGGGYACWWYGYGRGGGG
jgi:hypothetical protein